MRHTRYALALALGVCSAAPAHAALLGTCTFSGGCGPDFAILDAAVSYSYDGSIGTLTVDGTAGNSSFLDGQLSPWPDESEVIGALAGKDPDVSINVLPATAGNDDFLLTMTVDGSGNLIGGSMTMNGKVAQFFSSLNNTNPDFQTAGLYTATSANGTLLDGALISGSSITDMGFGNTALDFRATLDPASLLTVAGFGDRASGVLSLNGISTASGNIEWDTGWTAASATLDVVVPVPAALWLFLSGAGLLFTTARKGRTG